jgi:hypothetical protein
MGNLPAEEMSHAHQRGKQEILLTTYFSEQCGSLNAL